MARYYSVSELSENIKETPEGYLVCLDVPITMAGEFAYKASEVALPAKDGIVTLVRTVEGIHNSDTIASFEGKPVTLGHPKDFVSPENWKSLSVGVVQNVRAGTGEHKDKMLADFQKMRGFMQQMTRGGMPGMGGGFPGMGGGMPGGAQCRQM
jgi:hypothetical protein